MASWCNTTDVESQLGTLEGRNFAAPQVDAEIENATILLKSELGVIISAAQLDAWDADITTVPPALRIYCAKLAAAQLLQSWVAGESKADVQTIAGGLYREYTDFLRRVNANKAILLTSTSDNAVIATQTASIVSSSAGRTRKFSVGDEGLNTTGTLDNL